jgi:hypothetical protein
MPSLKRDVRGDAASGLLQQQLTARVRPWTCTPRSLFRDRFTRTKEIQMTTSTHRPSRKDKQPRLSDQLKASDLFPPGTGWNNAAPGVGADARHVDSRQAPEPHAEPRQH